MPLRLKLFALGGWLGATVHPEVQDQVAKLAMTAIEYAPMQKGASFNLDAVKEKIAEAIKKQ